MNAFGTVNIKYSAAAEIFVVQTPRELTCFAIGGNSHAFCRGSYTRGFHLTTTYIGSTAFLARHHLLLVVVFCSSILHEDYVSGKKVGSTNNSIAVKL